MTNRTNSVSTIIKTYDDSAVAKHHGGAPSLKELLIESLRALETQTLLPREILVVDSSAGDGIAETLRRYTPASEVPIRRVPLAPADFSYPHALNWGIQHAEGEIVVSLSGDAIPANARWLEALVAPLANPDIAGAFSRHVARPGAPRHGQNDSGCGGGIAQQPHLCATRITCSPTPVPLSAKSWHCKFPSMKLCPNSKITPGLKESKARAMPSPMWENQKSTIRTAHPAQRRCGAWCTTSSCV